MRAWLVLLAMLPGCGGQRPHPVTIDTANDACAQCRMVVSNPRLAAQIVAAGEEPQVFDDIGCLRDFLGSRPLAPTAVIYVADHRTGAWVEAAAAVYTRIRTEGTPMASGIVAHIDAASREADATAVGGERISGAAVLGTERAPQGAHK